MDITLGDLVDNNVSSKEDLEKLLDKKGITDIKEKQEYINDYEKMIESFSKLNETISKNFKPIAEKLIKIVPKPIVQLSNYFSDIFKPLFNIFKDFSEKLRELIPSEWVDKLLVDLKENRNFYFKKLRKSYSIFRTQFFIYKRNKDKLLILFSQLVLYLSAIFENYTKGLLKIFRNQPKELREVLFRDDIKTLIKEFYEPIEINYSRLFGYLYNIADNIKHEDLKFYKRYSKYSSEELLNESNELYLDLKLYIKKSLVSFFIVQVRLFHRH